MNKQHGFAGPYGAAAQHDQPGTHDLDLVRIARALWRGRRLIAAVGVASLVLSGVYGFSVARPKYAATTLLVLKQPSDPVIRQTAGIQGLPADQTDMNTELHIIESRGLVLDLIDEFALTGDPEFNPALRRSTGSTSSSLRPTAVALDAEQLDQVVRKVRDAISARVQRNTHIFSISITSEDREKAAQMANGLARLYLQDQVDTKFAAAENAVKWLSQRVGSLQQDLAASEDAIAGLKARMELTSVEALALTNARLKDGRARLADLSQKARQAESNAQQLDQFRQSGDIAAIAALTSDAELSRLLTDQKILANASQIDMRLGQIEAQFHTARQRLVLQLSALERSVDELEATVATQGDGLAQLHQLEREAQATRVLYETLLSRLKEASTLRGLQQADARVLSAAAAGTYQSPRKAWIMLLSMLVGMTVASIYVLSKQFIHSGFRTADELEEATGRPVLGQIPVFPVDDRSELVQFLAQHPTAASVEAIRNLRTSLLMSNIDQPPQVILTASALPGEGKTTHAVALAQNLAGLGKCVLLIEGDIRRRTLARYFPTTSKGGIVSVLAGEVSLSDAVQHVPALGADVLLGETSQSSAADIFASRRFEELMKTARASYDIIVIDSPPVLVVPDARVIARHADAVLFMVAWDKTTGRQVAEGLRQFELAHCGVTGMVLSQVKPLELARYGYGETNPAYAGLAEGYYSAT